jgi:hypothetical protein
MSDTIKHVLKKIIFWACFAALFNLCIWSPNIYWHYTTGTSGGYQALCSNQSTSASTQVTVADIVLENKSAAQVVDVSGQLVYAPEEDMFFLQDGILRLPLDLSDCQNLDNFKKGEPLVVAKGTVTIDNDKVLLVVNGLRSTVPDWFQVLYSGGVFGSIIFAIFVIIWLAKGLAWLLAKIGIGFKNKQPLSPEARKNRQAGFLLLIGLAAPLLWLLNPYLGAVIHLLALLFLAHGGLRSGKRTVAIIGVCLCSAGLVVMFFVSLANFYFYKSLSNANFFASSIWSSYSAKAPKTGPLALEQYVNNANQFSLHPPQDWSKDESGEENMVVKFEAPAELAVAEGKSIHAKIGVMVIIMPLEGFKLADLMSEIKKAGAAESQDFKLINEGTSMLSGGRLTASYLEATALKKDIDFHTLIMIVQKGTMIYMIGINAPSKDWDTYQAVMRDSLRTFRAW